MSKTILQLEKFTEKFFDMYWKEEFVQRPTWSIEWKFVGEVPNRTKKGCYALFEGEDVAYIGLAIGEGKKDDGGIGQRVGNYWKKGGKQYAPTAVNEKWLTSIRTISFEEHFYLAAALEVFLIKQMSPKMNKTYKKIAAVVSSMKGTNL